MKNNKPLLLLIDIQNAYAIGEEWECSDIDIATSNIRTIVNSSIADDIIATKYMAPVNPTGVWVEYNRLYEAINNNEFLCDYTPSLKDILENAPGSCNINHFIKEQYSALSVPEIRKACQKAPYVIVCGITTGCCVLSTIMELIDAGIYAVVVKDATASTSPARKDSVWEVLAGLSPLHVSMIDTSDLSAFDAGYTNS